MTSVSQDVRDNMHRQLAGLDSSDVHRFDLRVQRWWDDLIEPLERLYGQDRAASAADELLQLAARTYAERDPKLRDLDELRLLTPDWLQRPDVIGYSCYADRFAGSLRGIEDHLDYLGELGVSYLHLMPVLKPRDGDNDGGYAVQDYRSIRPDLGSMDDLRQLAATLHEHGISLVLDLVLNHVAREHEWAQKAREGDPAYQDYFYIYPDRTIPDDYEKTLPEVFPDFAPGNFTYDPQIPGWVWTTFNEWQWDVNWSNPRVLIEYAEIVCFLADLGVDVIRLDAIAFTWKRMGTNCQNQPEVHDITQVLRTVARIASPAVAFKAEAIVGPRDLVQYLGTGTHVGRVSDIAYHNSFMVQVWSMLAAGDTVLGRYALQHLPLTPSASTWLSYARCHDDIGWAIDDGDAAALGLSGFEHRRFLSEWYSGEFPGSWANGLVFQENPATGDRRISGTAASLLGLHNADDESALARMFLAHAMVFGWDGFPVIWSGDELGMPNDPGWASEAGHEDDNRWAHRPRLDWYRAARRADTHTVEGKVFQGLVHLSRTRKALAQLHASAPVTVADNDDTAVLVVRRLHASGAFLGVYNVRDESRSVPAGQLWPLQRPWNALGEDLVEPAADGRVWLPPYAAWWLVEAPESID